MSAMSSISVYGKSSFYKFFFYSKAVWAFFAFCAKSCKKNAHTRSHVCQLVHFVISYNSDSLAAYSFANMRVENAIFGSLLRNKAKICAKICFCVWERKKRKNKMTSRIWHKKILIKKSWKSKRIRFKLIKTFVKKYTIEKVHYRKKIFMNLLNYNLKK